MSFQSYEKGVKIIFNVPKYNSAGPYGMVALAKRYERQCTQPNPACFATHPASE
jgi:hypothetical protein